MTAAVTPSCDIHDSNLMNAVRTCYNIYLIAKTPSNQNAAKTNLTHMLNAIFVRMAALKGTRHTQPREMEEPKDNSGTDSLGPTPVLERKASKRTSTDKPEAGSISENPPLTPVSLGTSVEKLPNGTTESRKSLEEPRPSEHTANGVEEKKEEHKTDEKKEGEHKDETKKAEPLADEVYVSSLTPIYRSATNINLNSTNGELIYHDSYLVFRALCKLSMKEIPPKYVTAFIPFIHPTLTRAVVLAITSNHSMWSAKSCRWSCCWASSRRTLVQSSNSTSDS